MKTQNILTSNSHQIETFLQSLKEQALRLLNSSILKHSKSACLGIIVIKPPGTCYSFNINLSPPDKPIAEIVEQLAQLSDQGANLYFRNCLGPEHKPAHCWKESDVLLPLGVSFDRDGDERGKAGAPFGLKPTLVVQTSHGSYHEHYWTSDVLNLQQHREISSGLTQSLGCDVGSEVCSHLYRIPGTINYPTKKKADQGRCPERVEWQNPDEQLQRYSFGELLASAEESKRAVSFSTPLHAVPNKPQQDKPSLDTFLSKALNEVWIVGTRSDRNMAVIDHAMRLGFSEDDVFALALEHPFSLGAKMAEKGKRWMREEIHRIFEKVSKSEFEKIEDKQKLKGKKKKSMNLEKVHDLMTMTPEWHGVFQLNEFTGRTELSKPLPNPDKLKTNQLFTPHPLTDTDENRALLAVQKAQGFAGARKDHVLQAISILAENMTYHPVRDYIQSLRWDGIKRLSGWLEKVGANIVDADNHSIERRTLYLSAVSRAVLISAVARVFDPGCKADNVLVLEGTQCAGKSRLIRALCPNPEWFSDSLPGDLHHKDARQHLQGKWLVEMAELASVKRTDIDATKAYLTTQEDKFRPAYGRNEVSLPRQCIFIATTNSFDWGRDDSGNRRFLPVRFEGTVDVTYIHHNRDQLFAEAYAAYKAGEVHYLQGEALYCAEREQAARQTTDVMTEKVLEMHAKLCVTHPPTAEAILADFTIGLDWKLDRELYRVTRILRKAGFHPRRIRFRDRQITVWWKDSLGPMPISTWEEEASKAQTSTA